MPWKECSVMDERLLRFVARLLDGEAMTDVCPTRTIRHSLKRPFCRSPARRDWSSVWHSPFAISML